MANIYWIQGGADAHWDTWDGNWFDDAAGTTGAGHVPQDTDFAYLTGATAPDSGPAVPVSLSGLDTSGLAAAVTITDTVSVTETLVLGGRGGTDIHEFGGDASTATSIIVQGASVIGTGALLGSNPLFFDSSTCNTNGTITRGVFYESSGATSAVFATSIHCHGNQTFTEADGELTYTGLVNIYVFGSLTINNTGATIITGVPNILLMSRTANFRPIGDVTVNVVMYRPAITHRQRSIS